MRMPIEKIIKKIMDNRNLYKRTEGDFRIHGELYETIWNFLEGLKESNNKKIETATKKLDEFLENWKKKSTKEKIKQYRMLLSATLAFSSTISKTQITMMISKGEITNNQRIPILLNFVDKLEQSCIEFNKIIKNQI